MSAYAKELEFLQSGKPSGSFVNRKEMRLDTFDGAYEGLPRWISQLRAAARLRGWLTQLEPDYLSPPSPDAVVQLELESAMALSFEAAALQYYEDACEAHAGLSDEDLQFHYKAAFVLAHVAAAVRLRHRGSLFRQTTAMLDPARRCLAGDSASVLAALDLHSTAIRDLKSAARADPRRGSWVGC